MWIRHTLGVQRNVPVSFSPSGSRILDKVTLANLLPIAFVLESSPWERVYSGLLCELAICKEPHVQPGFRVLGELNNKRLAKPLTKIVFDVEKFDQLLLFLSMMIIVIGEWYILFEIFPVPGESFSFFDLFKRKQIGGKFEMIRRNCCIQNGGYPATFSSAKRMLCLNRERTTDTNALTVYGPDG